MEVQLRNYLRIKQLKANIKVFLTVNGFSPEEKRKISSSSPKSRPLREQLVVAMEVNIA